MEKNRYTIKNFKEEIKIFKNKNKIIHENINNCKISVQKFSNDIENLKISHCNLVQKYNDIFSNKIEITKYK
tara:strand:+ start:286 stop:501 length:216 start_codon:yes stop_codon:yes gene_type:complete